MPRIKSRKYSCIWIQIIQTPTDQIAQIEYPVGTRIILNKKKFPYLFKRGYLWFKTKSGIAKLYYDDIVIIIEKKYPNQFQKNIVN